MEGLGRASNGPSQVRLTPAQNHPVSVTLQPYPSDCRCNGFVTAASCSPSALPIMADWSYQRLPHYPVAAFSFQLGFGLFGAHFALKAPAACALSKCI